jgi:hypothetical protein
MDISDDLIKLFQSDDGHMFVPPKKQAPVSADDRLAVSFRQIVEFVEKNDRLPELESNDISEASLAARLSSIRNDKAKVEALKPIDTRGLLDVPEPPESIDDLFSKDTFGLFEGAGENILRIKNIPLTKRSAPEDVASRVRAKDFDTFRDGFDETQKGLGIGTLKLVRFTNVKQLKAGHYFIAGGQMLYVDEIGEEKLVHGRMKSRLRAIYENGTESNLYLRSLSSQLYYDGYCVVESDYAGELKLDTDDKIVGYIYVLKSQSEDEKIMALLKTCTKLALHDLRQSLSASRMQKKIRHTLMSGVEVVDSYIITGDYNPQKVEHFIHRIFADAKVELTIIDKNGREYTPSEWYSVPQLIAIEQAVNMLQNGDIVDYHYNKDLQADRAE